MGNFEIRKQKMIL